MPSIRPVFLLSQLARREIAGRYKGQAIGLLWSFVSPLMMLLVYTFVFSVVFKARWGDGGEDKLAFALNLFAGIIVHGFFAECIGRAPAFMQQHVNYVKRVIFPLWILPPVIVVAALFHAAISTLALLLVFGLSHGYVHWQALLLPLVALPLLLVVSGLSWLLTALGVFFRDLGQVVPVIITVTLFMAPVFYPVSALPEAYRHWLYLNPLTPAIEMMRQLLLEGTLPALDAWLRYLIAGLLCALFGLWFFRRVQRGFADVL